jgi:hypothetical protein
MLSTLLLTSEIRVYLKFSGEAHLIAELKKKQHRVSKIQTIKISSILFKRISDQISPDIFISCLFSVSLRTVVLNGRDT